MMAAYKRVGQHAIRQRRGWCGWIAVSAVAVAFFLLRTGAGQSQQHQEEQLLLRSAKNRGFRSHNKETDGIWNGPFEFVQLTDPQLGMLHGDASWEEEEALLRLAVQRVNKHFDADGRRPKFLLVSGDLINRFPSDDDDDAKATRARQRTSLTSALSALHPSIPLVLQPGNHDLGQGVPTPRSLSEYTDAFGDDYFSFWMGGVFYIAINSQYYAQGGQPADAAQRTARDVQHAWLLDQLAQGAGATHVVVLSHIAPFMGHEEEGWGWANWEPAARREIPAAAAAARVRLWISGHYHGNSIARSVKGLEVVVSSAAGSIINWTCPAGVVAVQERPDFNKCVGNPKVVANERLAGMRIFRIARHKIEHRWTTLR